MKEYKKDTSAEYDDLVGYIAEDNLPKDLSNFLGEAAEYKPEVKQKKTDPEFSEQWQEIYVNFRCQDDYIEFMEAIGHKPVPKLKQLIYETEQDDGLLKFLGV